MKSHTEVAVMNGEEFIIGVQIVDTTNSEKENSPIKLAIILRRMRMIHHYLMARKVKMKSRLKINNHGFCNKKTKMKTLLPRCFMFLIVSLAETETNSHCMSFEFCGGPFLH